MARDKQADNHADAEDLGPLVLRPKLPRIEVTCGCGFRITAHSAQALYDAMADHQWWMQSARRLVEPEP